MKFRFISHCRDIEFFLPVKEGMRDAAQLLGVEAEFVGTEDLDIEEQKALFENALKEGVDGIATSITHETFFNDSIEKALARNIPVVCFNVDASNGGGSFLASTVQDTFLAGKKLGQYMEGRMGDSSRALLTLHSEGIPSLEKRKRGVLESLAGKNVQWDFLITGNGADEAEKRIKEHLQNNPDIEFIFGTGQDDTEGAGRAVEALGLTQSISVCGFDLAPKTIELIKRKVICATVDQQPYIQGFYPVMQLYHYVTKKLIPSDIDAGSGIVDFNAFKGDK